MRGGYAVHDTVPLRIAPDTTLWLTLAGEVNLTNAVDPQLTFWVRGHLWHYSGLRFQVSTDGGLTWPELAAVNLDTGFNAGLDAQAGGPDELYQPDGAGALPGVELQWQCPR
ncbi:MAG: hypothetical protein V9H26_03160 [Verrucomicrobiota bacterium]